MSPPYYNRLHSRLPQEQEAVHRARVVPFGIPSEAFDALAAAGVRMVFVVLAGSGLVAAPRRQRGEHISHAVLADGGPVLAAGEFEVEFDGATMFISAINNMSGHFQPPADSLEVAQEAFGAAGIHVRPDAVTPYDFRAP
ncbi:hypothetical protein [Candidatus Poriferisodalis sp.]|uniref:hypothetical protein n=1 Tax=Candidatus Poriferisodalis sp. TaxID=3101277 RepID=UPI003B5C617C